RAERAGPDARRRGDPTPDPAGRAERPSQGREGGTRPLQSAGERAPRPTLGSEAEEAPPRRRAAWKAPTGAEAPRVPTDDLRPDGRQGARAHRRHPTPSIGGQETGELARRERRPPEDERGTESRGSRGRSLRGARGGTGLRTVQEG